MSAIAVHPDDPFFVVVGMTGAKLFDGDVPNNIFLSVDAGETFRVVPELEDDLPMSLVFSMSITRDGDGDMYLWAGTGGSLYRTAWPSEYEW